MTPPHGKILKKDTGKISNKVVYVYYVRKAVGQTNNVPPPQTKLGLYTHIYTKTIRQLSLVASERIYSQLGFASLIMGTVLVFGNSVMGTVLVFPCEP
jgi:hypothetical protein